jgi:Cd2+/Zn2+-exporting ATPase
VAGDQGGADRREDQEWRLLAKLADGLRRRRASRAWLAGAFPAPGLPWLAKGVLPRRCRFPAAGTPPSIRGTNLKKREVDIHFLMLAVALGAMFIGAWGEAVLLLFLFSASGAMEEYALDRTQREVSALLKSVTQAGQSGDARRIGQEKKMAVEDACGSVQPAASAAGRGVPRGRADRD